MTDFARLMSDYFVKYLAGQKGSGSNTMKTYRVLSCSCWNLWMRRNISGLTVSKWTVSATTLLMSFWSILKKRKEYPYLPEITVLLR